ncbi:MAG: sulfatase [Planctomycetota bacterium]
MSSPPLRLALRRALAVFLLAASCGTGDELPGTESAIPLLRRLPDRLLEQRGELVPDLAAGWGDARPYGWEPAVEPRVGERTLPHVWSKMTRAHLRLTAGSPRDRALALTLWGPPAEARGGAPYEAVATLNGMELRRFELPVAPTEVTIDAPAVLWQEGRNLLVLAVDRLLEISPERRVGVALARVAYDVSLRVQCDPEIGRVVLAGETGVDYDLEPFAGTRLLLGGRAIGAGTLAVSLSRVDPADTRKAAVATEFAVELADRSLERAFVLPEAGGNLVRLELRWTAAADSGARFELTRLDRVETVPRELPPIVYVAIDTLAAANLQLYGYSRNTAPHLEEFAREAILFERCTTNAPWTVPSFMSVMTGLYPNAHEIDWKAIGQGHPELWEQWLLAPNRWTLAEMLRACGYQTGGIVDSVWLCEAFGFMQGYDHYDIHPGTIFKTDPQGGIRMVNALAAEWLARVDLARPFLLFYHVLDVHDPYTPPPGYRGRFRNDDLYDPEPSAFAGGFSSCYGIIPIQVARGEIPEGDIPPRMSTSPFRSAYDEEIALVDDELHSFFEHLKSIGVYDRALIIVAADHGETMDEGDFLFGHGVLDDAVTHVPLLVRLPGGRNGGRRVGTPVQLVDLYPTILDFVNPGVVRGHLHGRSLRRLLEGGELPPKLIYAEGGILRQSMAILHGWKLVEKQRCHGVDPAVVLSDPALPSILREGVLPTLLAQMAEGALGETEPEDALEGLLSRFPVARRLFEGLAETGMTPALYAELKAMPGFWRLLGLLRREMQVPFHALYYLPDDPKEQHDLAAERPEKVAELLPLLRAEEARREEARARAALPTTPVELSPEDIDHLRKLGYADGGGSNGR